MASRWLDAQLMMTASGAFRTVAVGLCLGFLVFRLSSCTSSQTTSSGSVTIASDVVTFHNDNARTGQSLNETVLTPNNVHTPTFGKVAFFIVDGKVDAQPLYLSNVNVPDQGHIPCSTWPRNTPPSMPLTQVTVKSCGTFPCWGPESLPAIPAIAMRRLIQKSGSQQHP